MSNKKSGKFSQYRAALEAVSQRTGTALPSLIASFAILHELTAIVPFIGLFFGARALGLGETFVGFIRAETDGPAGDESWIRRQCRAWMDEGERFANRVGRRYGIWGFEKRNAKENVENLNEKQSTDPTVGDESNAPTKSSSSAIAGDVANAVVAYAATKVRAMH